MFALLPTPAELSVGSGLLPLRAGVVIDAEVGLATQAQFLSARFAPAGLLAGVPGREPVADPADSAQPVPITLRTDPRLAVEEYRLLVGDAGVEIAGGTAGGVLHGCVTLLQLLDPDIHRAAPIASTDWQLPKLSILDRPRFGWRGALLDVARHFFPKRDVLRFIDQLAMHKLNVLHLHLTDDQGWRVEVPQYPRLTEIGGWRRESPLGASPRTAPGDGRPHGGFYSQDDLREIVAYAAARNITVVPEIDLPGHMQAAIAAYPELGVTGRPVEVSTRWGVSEHVLNAEAETLDFVLTVLDSVLEIFDSPYLAIGGDECPTSQWEADPRTRERLHELGLQTPADIQRWYVEHVSAHLQRHNRRVIAWDEVLGGDVDPAVTIAAWRGTEVAEIAAARGHQVISCPNTVTYLDYRESDHPGEPIPFAHVIGVESAYLFDPVPAGVPEELRPRFLGGQGNVWTENIEDARAADYMTFPRLAALADALWRTTPADLDAFAEKLPVHLRRLDAMGIEYRPPAGPHPWQQRPDAEGEPHAMAATIATNEALTRDIVRAAAQPGLTAPADR